MALAPAAALAQDAGSNQYQDPLAGQPGTGGHHGGGGGGTSNVRPSSASQTQAAQSGNSSQTTRAAQAGNQLPRTGVDTWLLALCGAMLLAGGLGLRRVADRPDF
ncbi:MAG: hypothetical protein QOE06_2550 [Thermoleophilaceae bacterium]|nr:hypothetical protein [Thermoleophilaceae bacterium]